MVSQIMPMKPFATQSPMDLAFQTLIEGDFQSRWDLAKVIPGFGEEAIAPLSKLLRHPDAELRWFAARILGELDHPQAIALLVELLATPEEEIQSIAYSSLAKSGTKSIPALINKLVHPATRLLAVQALSQIYSEATIAPLLEMTGDEDVMVRTTAIAALHSYPAPEIIPIFIKGLSDVAASVRCQSVTGLGLIASRSLAQCDWYGLKPQELVDILSPCLADPSPEVAQQAAIALRRTGTEAAVICLGEFLTQNLLPLESPLNALDTSTKNTSTNLLNLQIEIIRQLGWMAQPLALEYLQQSLNHKSPEVWLEIVMILGRVETSQPQACKILSEMLEPRHPGLARTEIRQALASSLGQLKEPAGRLALSQLLKDSDRSVQLHSQFALKLIP
jgi:HEAT repeat protein